MEVTSITSIAALASEQQQVRTGQAVDIAVMKKALDVQASTATALLAALPAIVPANLPPHLGQNINTTA